MAALREPNLPDATSEHFVIARFKTRITVTLTQVEQALRCDAQWE